MASLLAVQSVIMQGKNSFELYGYDILLDEDLTPWLLEVNASPALTGTDSEDYRLKFDLLDDTLNVLDFEGRFTGRETRIGGFDLLWNDGPVWTYCPNPSVCGEPSTDLKKLNIFLGARNDRVEQLRQLRQCLEEKRNKVQSDRVGMRRWWTNWRFSSLVQGIFQYLLFVITKYRKYWNVIRDLYFHEFSSGKIETKFRV